MMSEQHLRLAAFRRIHPPPAVVISRDEFGAGWEATIRLPRDNGSGYFKPRPLRDLLDALEEELDSG